MALAQEARRLRVAWISDYPIEWMEDLPDSLNHLRRQHPAPWMRALVEQFQQQGDMNLHVILLRSRIPHPVTMQHGGTTFSILKASRVGRLASLFWLDTILIRKQLKLIQPDLVHAWGTERGATLVASRLASPSLATVQGILTWVVEATTQVHPYYRLLARLERLALSRARCISAESIFAQRYIAERYPSARVLHADYAPHKAFFNVQRQPAQGCVKLVTVGTIGQTKGTDLLLTALDRLVNDGAIELVLIGAASTEAINSLKAKVSPALWNRVQLKSGLTSDQVAGELARATLMVLPTRADTGPTAVKEAAVAGLPVVGSNIGGIPDYITHGRNGMLFPAGDVNALEATLREALKHPLFSRGQVDVETWRNVRDHLSPQRMAKNFLNAYSQVLKAWGRDPSEWSALR